MFLSSAVRVLEATPMQVRVVIPPNHTDAVLAFVLVPFLLLGAVGLAGSRKVAAIMLLVVACGALVTGLNIWHNHTEISLSRAENRLVIERNRLTGNHVETYALTDVRAAVVDVSDAAKRVDFVLASGETLYVGDYEQRQGFEAAVVAINTLLGVQTPAPVGPQ